METCEIRQNKIRKISIVRFYIELKIFSILFFRRFYLFRQFESVYFTEYGSLECILFHRIIFYPVYEYQILQG